VDVNTPNDVGGGVSCAICGATVKRTESGSVLIGCNACRPGGYWVTRKCADYFDRMRLSEVQVDALKKLIEKGVGSEDRPIHHHVIESL
jgi:hypothetical protein